MVKKKFKHASLKTKIILSLGFVLFCLFLILVNKSILNDLIPVDYMQDPHPFKQACEAPASSPKTKTS